MEFRDENGCIRYFRMEDQLEKTDNKTLKFYQTKLDPNQIEEYIFYGTLQRQIDGNEEKQ